MVLPRLSVLKVVSRTTLPMLFRHHFQRRSTIYKIKVLILISKISEGSKFIFSHNFLRLGMSCSALITWKLERGKDEKGTHIDQCIKTLVS